MLKKVCLCVYFYIIIKCSENNFINLIKLKKFKVSSYKKYKVV